MEDADVCRSYGFPSGEIFVRIHHSSICSEGQTLYGARPFLQQLLLESHTIEQGNQPWKGKFALLRRLRHQIKIRRKQVETRWRCVQDAIKTMEIGTPPPMSCLSVAVGHYLDHFGHLEQMYQKHVIQGVLQHYALLEAEREYIRRWSTTEEALCLDLLARTKRLYQLNLFGAQLESETSGQIRMWQLPANDPQRLRCVKAATENVKRNFFSKDTSDGEIEVLDVFKIDNRPLLHSFQCFTSSLAPEQVRIKGLFCYVPVECIDHCVVWGMHYDEQTFLQTSDLEINVFNRVTLSKNDQDAPGTTNLFPAKQRAMASKPIAFPRRFSRYSTLEENRNQMSLQDTMHKNVDGIQYLALCRVQMGKTIRIRKPNESTAFPEDRSVGALHIADEEEYLVRYPQAVVPEFLIQFRAVWTSEYTRSPNIDSIIQTNLTDAGVDVPSASFQTAIQELTKRGKCSASVFPFIQYPVGQDLPPVFVKESTENHGRSHERKKAEHSKAAHDRAEAQPLKNPETILANYMGRRALIMEDMRTLQNLFWEQCRTLWSEVVIDDHFGEQNCPYT